MKSPIVICIYWRAWSIPRMPEMTALPKSHEGNDSRKRHPSPNLKKEATDAQSESFLVRAFTASAGNLEEKHLQRDNLKGIDSRHKNNSQSMRSPKGAKHYLIIVTMEGKLLKLRNQRKWLSCNYNTKYLRNKNYRLEYQPTKKSETLEHSCVKEMGESEVPVGDYWK